MLSYIEYLSLPEKVAFALVAFYLAMNLIGEVLEFIGIVVPEFMKLRKLIQRKREERKAILEMARSLPNLQKTVSEFNSHYSEDNISKRDEWIRSVDGHLSQNDTMIKSMAEKLLELLIENNRGTIIDFASRVIDDTVPATKEEFNRIFRMHKDYEKTIAENNLTNGEVDIAIQIISDSYEKRMRNHTFVEDIRGYGSRSV